MTEFREPADATRSHGARHAPSRYQEALKQGSTELVSALGNAQVNRVLHGVQRSGATSDQHLDESVARAIEDRRGRGAALREDVRANMEGALGHDLSDVRVHTDSDAHDLNEAVGARAFTTGSDVFFKQGAYDPGSSSGKELLAHELTHVVQQRQGTSGLKAGQVSDPSDAAEVAASEVGQAVANAPDGVAGHRAGHAPSVARQEEEEELQMSADASAVQRQEEPEEEELQMSVDASAIQRQEEPEEEELQMSRDLSGLQRRDDEDLAEDSR